MTNVSSNLGQDLACKALLFPANRLCQFLKATTTEYYSLGGLPIGGLFTHTILEAVSPRAGWFDLSHGLAGGCLLPDPHMSPAFCM